jgi:transglutaminase-like putative cysteine protease
MPMRGRGISGAIRRSRPLQRLLCKVFVALLLAGAGCAATAASASAADYKYLRYHDTLEIQEDGSFVETYEIIKSPLSRSAVDWMGQVDLSFSQNLAELEVLEAYILKPDDRRVDVPPESIKLQDEPVSNGAPMFTDEKHKIIIFPELEVDDRIVYRVRIHQREAYYPGHYLDMWYFPDDVEVADTKIEISVPATRPLMSDATGFVSDGQQRRGDRIVYRWHYENSKPADYNIRYAVDSIDYGLRLNVSTMKDYGALAAAYEARAADKAVPDDKIKKLAHSLTAGITDRKEQARKLYEWVNLNIRYVATYIGAGGYVPHHAADVLRNRYGDCKDHVVLLESLLAAKGIDSSAAILNSDDSYLLPKVPSRTPFNHAITYIPEFDLFVDSTDYLQPFGLLGAALADKPVIVTKLKDPIRYTPAVDAKTSGVLIRTSAKLRSDGSVEGVAHAEYHGTHGSWMRSDLADAGDGQMEEWATHWLIESGLQGKSTLKPDDPFLLADPFKIGADFSTGRILDLSLPGAFYVPESHLMTYSLKEMASFMLGANQNVNVVCGALGLRQETEVELPEEIEVLNLPPALHEKKGAVEYTASYKMSGRKLTVVREFIDSSPHGQCTPAEMRDQADIATAINRDLQRLVLYRPSPSL